MRYLRTGFTITVQTALLSLIYGVGVIIERKTQIPIPGNVLGMMLLFFLLETGLIPLQMVEKGADFLLRHLTLLFIPVVTALIPWGDFIRRNGAAVMAAIILSGFVALAVTGILADRALVRDEGKEEAKCSP